jgi:hypothetical protein
MGVLQETIRRMNMKKIIATGLICVLALSAAGCGERKNETGLNKAPVSTESTASASSDLYEDLKEGKGTIKYRGTGDRGSYIDTSSILEVGKAYTIDEIIEACKTIDVYNEDDNPNITYKEIDCGRDGVPELLVEIEFGASSKLAMIVKEIDHELVMCFDQDGGARYYVDVKDNGVIESGGAGAANVHDLDYAFVDGNGDYHFYYGVSETMAPFNDFYAYTHGEDYSLIPIEGLDVDHLGIRDYYFEADFKDRNHLFTCFTVDDNYKEVPADADSEDTRTLKQRFSEAGIETCTADEIEKKLGDRAKEIGYPG